MACIELVGNAHRLDVRYLADSITIPFRLDFRESKLKIPLYQICITVREPDDDRTITCRATP